MTSTIGIVFLVLLVTSLLSVIKGAPFVASERTSISRMIKLASVKKGDKIVDLGSGDGRVVIAFAKKGINAHGFEINPLLVIFSNISSWMSGTKARTKFFLKDMWHADLSKYDVVVVYAMNHLMSEFENKCQRELKSGAKVITYSYKFEKRKPNKVIDNTNLYIF